MVFSHSPPTQRLGLTCFLVGALVFPRVAEASSKKGWLPAVAAELPAGTSGLGVFIGGENERPRGPSAIVAGTEGRILVIDGENERAVEIRNRAISNTAALPNARSIRDAADAGDGRIVAFDGRSGHLWMLDAALNAARVSESPLRRFRGLKRIAAGRVAVHVGEEAMELGVSALPSLLKALPVDPSPLSRFLPQKLPKFIKKPLKMLDLKKLAVRGNPTRAGSLEIAFERGVPNLSAFRAGATNAHRREAVKSPAGGSIVSVSHLATDQRQRHFVRVEVMTETSPVIKIRRFIRVLDENLRELTTFEIPLDDVIVAGKDIDVDDSGNVLVMLPYQNTVRILRYAAP